MKIKASFSDPLGHLFPITLQCKLSFKLICIDKSIWNTLINLNLVKKIKDFINRLHKIKPILIPRYICGFPKKKVLSDKFFFNNFLFTQAKSLKFSDFKFLSFRHNVAKFH